MENRPAIPADIKLKVRQKCKFACVICRCPIYVYHHLEEYKICKEHTVENIFLLCPNCHKETHNNNISRKTILKAFQDLQDYDKTKPQKINNENFILKLGNNSIKSFSGYLFKIFDKDYFRVTKNAKNNFIIDAKLFDENKDLSLEIKNNEYVIYTDKWDISNSGGKFTFRDKYKKQFLFIQFDVENEVINLKGKLYLSNNEYLEINDNGIFCNDKILLSNTHLNKANKIGIAIIKDSQNHNINSIINKCKLTDSVIERNESSGNDCSLIYLSEVENCAIKYNKSLGYNSSVLYNSIVKNSSIENNNANYGLIWTDSFLKLK